MELALKTTKDSRGQKLLQFELDKVVLTNMHANPKNYKNFNFFGEYTVLSLFLKF